ncbi:hypothetical protein DFH06DRAFT_1472039 [Mycena polygramma]|nr:hypothetical protein DFH06DRAFT_1472039 [Mycena polygramma]
MSSASSGSNGEQHHQPIPVLAPADVQHAISLIQAAYAPSTATDLQQLQSLQSATTLRLAMQPTPAVWQGVYDGFLLSRWTSVARHRNPTAPLLLQVRLYHRRRRAIHCSIVPRGLAAQSSPGLPTPSSQRCLFAIDRYKRGRASVASSLFRPMPPSIRASLPSLYPFDSPVPSLAARPQRRHPIAVIPRSVVTHNNDFARGFPCHRLRAVFYALESSLTPGECALARAAAPSEALRLPGSTRLYAVLRERLPPSRATAQRVA